MWSFKCVSGLRGKTKLRNLQKDHDEMELRLKALREGSSLIANLQELNRKYLKHRTAHPEEVETVRKSADVWFGVDPSFLLNSIHELTVQANHLAILYVICGVCCASVIFSFNFPLLTDSMVRLVCLPC